MSSQALKIAPDFLVELYGITVSRAEREAADYSYVNKTKGPQYKIRQVPLDPPSYCNFFVELLSTTPQATFREVNR